MERAAAAAPRRATNGSVYHSPPNQPSGRDGKFAAVRIGEKSPPDANFRRLPRRSARMRRPPRCLEAWSFHDSYRRRHPMLARGARRLQRNKPLGGSGVPRGGGNASELGVQAQFGPFRPKAPRRCNGSRKKTSTELPFYSDSTACIAPSARKLSGFRQRNPDRRVGWERQGAGRLLPQRDPKVENCA